MQLVSWTNTHDVTDLVKDGIVKNTQKLEYLENRTELLYEIKKIVNLCLR